MVISKGKRGKFVFTAPFDKYNTDDVLEAVYYEQVGSSLSNGTSMYEIVYKPVGLTMNDMNNDIDNAVWIVGLAKDNGTVLYIPENRITESIPTESVEYHRTLISVDLGLIPSDEDIVQLMADIKTLTESTLGILPCVKEVVVSGGIEIPKGDHDITMTARNLRKGDGGNYKNKVAALESAIRVRDNTIASLDCVIKKLNV